MSRGRRLSRGLATALVVSTGAQAGLAEPAHAFNPGNSLKAACTVAGALHPTAKKVCTGLQLGLRAISALKSLFGGHLGGAVKSLLGQGGGAATTAASTAASAAVGLAAIGTWVLGGATFALHETAKVLGQTTEPQLNTTWFSSTYWRVAGLAAVLTLPFLFAAAVQALLRSDITLLLRAALGYLPLAMLAVAIAAPLTMLLLAASDQMASVVASASGNASVHFLRITGAVIITLSAAARSPFMVFLVGLLTVAGATTLWIELLVREAAVYVIVLMLPLVFAAMVWPARRVWALRAVELLVALILSKFAIVAVISLGGAALSTSFMHSVSGMLIGVALLGMGVFAPWALLRLIPLAELASSAASSLRSQGRAPVTEFGRAWGVGDQGEAWVATTAAMRRDSERGLSAGTDAPTQMNGAGPADASERRNGRPVSAEAGDDDHSEDDLPTPEPDAPDLAPARSGGAGREQPEPGSPAPPARRQSQRIPELPEIWQQDDLSWEPVILGPEGVPGPQRSQPSEQPEQPKSQSTRPPTPPRQSPTDDRDPTPPPQPPPEGRL
ncbi:MAG TPA: hypothetical protein VGY32_12065 [Solirubrobacteraceae bacterium]|nr:hypothetical protein [Solirubrobacteraceae bacterium]